MKAQNFKDPPFVNCGICKRKMEKVKEGYRYPNQWRIEFLQTWECAYCKEGLGVEERDRSKKVLC